eukprot:4466757-Amphidinium_carterae.1
MASAASSSRTDYLPGAAVLCCQTMCEPLNYLTRSAITDSDHMRNALIEIQTAAQSLLQQGLDVDECEVCEKEHVNA